MMTTPRRPYAAAACHWFSQKPGLARSRGAALGRLANPVVVVAI